MENSNGPRRSASAAAPSYSTRLLTGALAPLGTGFATFLLIQALVGGTWGWLLPIFAGLAAGVLTAFALVNWVRRPLSQVAGSVRTLLDTPPSSRDDLDLLKESITKLQTAAEKVSALQADREHLLAIVTSMSEGVLVVDSEGKAVIVNPHWLQLFGLPENMEGATPIELTRQTRLEQLIMRTLETGEGDQEEIELALPQGKTIIATSSAVSDRSGAVVVARDITDFLKLSEIRRDFVANVSHELKTPLSAIRGLAETLHDGALDDSDAAEHFVGRILRQCQRLEALLSDLLTLSRLEHPKSPTERQLVDLGQVVEEAIEVLASAARKREISIEVSVAPGSHELSGDREALDRLALNLLENGIKYNRPGGSVSVRLAERENELLFIVSDTGIGIPSDSVARLFERFYRVDKGRSREEGGTGLGLAIVKHATQLHGGRVEVESQLGVGTTFRVYLPAG